MTQGLGYAAASRQRRWPAIVIASALGAIGGFGLSMVLGMAGYQEVQTSPQVVDETAEPVSTESYERRIDRLKEEIKQLNAENSTLRDRIERQNLDQTALQFAEKRVAELEVELASRQTGRIHHNQCREA